MRKVLVLCVCLSMTMVLAATATRAATTATHQFSGSVAAWEADGWSAHSFRVPAGPVTIEATLSWPNSNADLNLFLYNPGGELRAMSVGSDNPETLRWNGDWSGTWTVGVKARSGGSDYQLSVQATSDGSSGSEATLSSHGGIATFAIEQEAPGHTWSRSEAIEHAERFDRITALRGSYGGHVAAMRAANPQLELYVYINGAFAQSGEGTAFPNDWYARNRHGQKIRNDWGLWMMDVRHPGWVGNRAWTCGQFIAESGYDGCMFDNMGAGTLWPPALTSQPINPATGNEWTDAEWLDATTHMASKASTQSGKPLVVNGLVSGTAYFASSRQLTGPARYAIAETFVRPARQPVHQYRDESTWKADLDMLVDAAARGKSVLAVTKVWSDATWAQKDSVHRYALGTFLLGNSGLHRFYFSYGEHQSPLEGHPWWDIELGQPSGAYYQAGGVYQRDFSAGKVAVNPTGTTRTVSLGGQYRTLAGTTVSQITLPPNTAEVLRKA